MTRHSVIVQELYRLSLDLGKSKTQGLFSEKQRLKMIRNLSAMQFLFSCLRMEIISEESIGIIIETLESTLHTRYFDFASDLLKAKEKTVYSIEQRELLFSVSYIVSLCISSLCYKEKNYKETVGRYIKTIQAITRSFLLPEHLDFLSVEDTNKMIHVYLKCD